MQKLFRCLLIAVATAGIVAPVFAQEAPPMPQAAPTPEGRPVPQGAPMPEGGPVPQGPPEETQGPPEATQGPPEATQGPPDQLQGPPDAALEPAITPAVSATPSVSGPRTLTVKIGDGRATVIARNVALREIIAEWARVGSTKVVNGEKLVGTPMSIELVDVPEKEALDILLRSAAGYMTGPRPLGVAGASMYDRVMILATSRPPAGGGIATAPQPFRTPIPMQQPPPDDDEGEPSDQGPMGPPGMQFPGSPMGQPQGLPTPGQMPPAAMPPGAMPPGAMPPGAMPPGAMPPGAVGPNGMPIQAPTTSPRPGQLPQQPGPANPYSPIGRPPGLPDDRQ